MTRGKYLLVFLGLLVGLCILTLLDEPSLFLMGYLTLPLVLLWASSWRAMNIGISPWWVLLLLVPGVNIGMLFYLTLSKTPDKE